jgi:TIR domain
MRDAFQIDRAVSASRYTVTVLSPAYLADCSAMFGEHLASHASLQTSHVIPLRLTDCELPLRLQARVALDFTDPSSWPMEVARLRALVDSDQ